MPDEESKSTVFRDYRGTKGAIEDAEGAPDERRRHPRGRVGVSRPKSPRTGVRDPGPAHKGEQGEDAYGAPTSPAPVQEAESEKRKKAKPDPLKPKE